MQNVASKVFYLTFPASFDAVALAKEHKGPHCQTQTFTMTPQKPGGGIDPGGTDLSGPGRWLFPCRSQNWPLWSARFYPPVSRPKTRTCGRCFWNIDKPELLNSNKGRENKKKNKQQKLHTSRHTGHNCDLKRGNQKSGKQSNISKSKHWLTIKQ